MNSEINQDPFADVYTCVSCKSETNTTAYKFERLSDGGAWETRHLIGGLCTACVEKLQDPTVWPAARSKMDAKLRRELDILSGGRNHV